MHSFDEFRKYWLKNSATTRKCFNMVFVVVYPDELPWDTTTEKLTQQTALQMSGGFTGAGTGTNILFLYKSELIESLKSLRILSDNLSRNAFFNKSFQHTRENMNANPSFLRYVKNLMRIEKTFTENLVTHAMICSIGWIMETVLDSKNKKTAIHRFMEWAEEDKEYCRGHIIAHPNKPAKLHHQHIEVNLKIWQELDYPDLYVNSLDYERAEDNFHDDYTPSWFKPKGMPVIRNFPQHERDKKAFGYPESKHHKTLHDVFWKEKEFHAPHKDKYFKIFTNRIKDIDEYYIDNNEDLNGSFELKYECDLLISPTAGYYTEIIAHKLAYPKKVIMYDYAKSVCDIKQMILDTNMTREEQIKLKDLGYGVNFNLDNSWQKNVYEFTTDEFDVYKLQRTVLEKSDVSVEVMDLLQFDYEKLIPLIEGKNVFFNASNIFGYHVVHAYYTLEEIKNKYEELRTVLSKYPKKCIFRGTNPVKKRFKRFGD